MSKGFEHKRLNAAIRNLFANNEPLLEYHRCQMEQLLMIDEQCEAILFMASEFDENDNLIEEFHRWYTSDQDMRERIMHGWTQFAIDLEEYKRKLAAGEIEPPKEMPKAETMVALPTLFIQAEGSITPESSQNLVKFSEKTAQYLADRKADLQFLKTSPDVTDQDVSNAKARGKDCREAVERLKLVQHAVLSQTATLGEAMATMAKLQEDYRLVAVDLEKESDKATDAKKLAILSKAKIAYAEHVAGVEVETKPIRLAVAAPDFILAMKNKKTIKGWQDSVDTALANGKIAADAEAKDIRAKLAWCKETSAGFGFLFADLSRLIADNGLEAFQAIVTGRIAKHKADETEKVEAERARMEAEATAKAEREAAAKLAESEEAIRADERKKAEYEAEIKARSDRIKAEVERSKLAQEAEFQAMVKKGTEAWKGVPDDFVEELRGGATGVYPVITGVPAPNVYDDNSSAPTWKPKPTDKELLDNIAENWGVSYGTACDFVLETAERLKVSP